MELKMGPKNLMAEKELNCNTLSKNAFKKY